MGWVHVRRCNQLSHNSCCLTSSSICIQHSAFYRGGILPLGQSLLRFSCVLTACNLQVYALKAADFEELLGDTHEAFLEHAKLMYSQKTAKQSTAEEASTHLVSKNSVQFSTDLRRTLCKLVSWGIFCSCLYGGLDILTGERAGLELAVNARMCL